MAQTPKAPAKKKMGRPTKYTPALGDLICSKIISGKSLHSICKKKHQGLPSEKTVFMWMRTHDDFRKNYDAAVIQRADAFAEQMVDIAKKATPETAAVARLQIDVRKWNAARMQPKKYGERTQTDVTSNGETISHSEIRLVGVSSDGTIHEADEE